MCPAQVAAAPAATPVLDEATVKAKSHAFFDAFDRARADSVEGILAPAFVWYETETFRDGAAFLGNLRRRADRHAPIHSRVWTDERVFISGSSAVFIGDAREHVPQAGEATPIDEEGANTLVWVRTGGHWTVALWQWERTGIEAERARWNARLADGREFTHEPNRTLVAAVKGRKPGTALDIMSGQGRNAVFLATQGWKVTAVDIADKGLELTREEAARRKVEVETVQSEIEKYDLGKDRWDLVTMIYAGADAKLLERIKPALKQGGLFVTEYFAADSDLAKSGAGGWDPKVLEAAFAGWKILRDDHVVDHADWVGQRKTKLVRFVAEKL